MKLKTHSSLWAVALLGILGGCVTKEVRIVDMTPPAQLDRTQSESELLDIGVAVFDPNVPEDYDEQIKALIQPDIRRAEANYMAFFAKNLLQSTGNWGAVRVVPRPTHAVDVVVSGRILHSDGESMAVELTVQDATGKHWFTRELRGACQQVRLRRGNSTGYRSVPDHLQDFRRRSARVP